MLTAARARNRGAASEQMGTQQERRGSGSPVGIAARTSLLAYGGKQNGLYFITVVRLF